MSDLQHGTPEAPTPAKLPTIYDVARAAGVSASTVSRAFSRPGRIRATTAEYVRRVAAELGYPGKPLGPSLPTGRTAMLALVVSDVTNPFYTEIMRGAQSAASDAGYILLLVDARETEAFERVGLERALAAIEGVILAGTRQSDSAIAAIAGHRPVVVLNREVPGVPSILLDNAQGMRAIVEHLTDLGHQSLTYVAGPEASWADDVRWRSLRAAADDLGCGIERSGPWFPTVTGGRAAAAALPPALPGTLPTAIATYNDQIAIGLILALRSRGICVPQEVSVVGFDDILPSQMVDPPLTTVAAPLRAQGRAAVNAVLSTLENPTAASRRPPQTLPVKLVVRASTGQARQAAAR
ncbi:MAG: LacI family DNA-binding transcriptional regulator [Streptomycetaceae bacterium]|nr:LacI family DNA-binding transcriptional regulator [Streptomycetaceae bacterium]